MYRAEYVRLLWTVLVSAAIVGCAHARVHRQSGAEPSSPAHGTINVFLGNENGLVVLTDSRLTYGNNTAVPEPAQKLFPLDGKSVATFAGFASQSLAMNPQVANKTSDVIQSYALELQGPYRDYHPNLANKLAQIAFTLRQQLELITAIARDVQQGRTFDIELTVAGVDNDGRLKIESVEMGLAPPGAFYSVYMRPPHEIVVEKNFVYYLRGVEQYARDVIENPQKYAAADPVISKYADSLKARDGSDLKLSDLQSLALFLAKETADKTQTVGPPYPYAEFSSGKIVGMELPFAQPSAVQSRPPFFLVWENHFDSPSRTPIHAPESYTLLFVDNDVSDRSVILDDGYFYGNTFTNCVLFYDGGDLNFVAGGNDVSHSTLLLGVHAQTNVAAVGELRTLKWASIREDRLQDHHEHNVSKTDK